VPYPDKVLADDEEVVAHLHPHALTVFWPVVRLLLVVGAASFGMAMIPVGPDQGVFRLVVLAVAVVLLLVSVVAPLLRWRTTHYVITTHRLLHRTGLGTRRGRDVALSRITDVSFSQTLWERVIRSGTLRVTSSGEGAVVLTRVPGSERVQTLLNHMIEEDADRRAQESAGYLGGEYRRGRGHPTGGHPTGGWGTGGFPTGGRRGGPDGDPHGSGPGFVTEWGTTEHRTAMFGSNPVA
jgi:membrane protein YdbS with pleckstrin-like domain